MIVKSLMDRGYWENKQEQIRRFKSLVQETGVNGQASAGWTSAVETLATARGESSWGPTMAVAVLLWVLWKTVTVNLPRPLPLLPLLVLLAPLLVLLRFLLLFQQWMVVWGPAYWYRWTPGCLLVAIQHFLKHMTPTIVPNSSLQVVIHDGAGQHELSPWLEAVSGITRVAYVFTYNVHIYLTVIIPDWPTKQVTLVMWEWVNTKCLQKRGLCHPFVGWLWLTHLSGTNATQGSFWLGHSQLSHFRYNTF